MAGIDFIALVPRWASNLHAEVDQPFAMPDDSEMTVQSDVSYKYRIYLSGFEPEVESSKPHTFVDVAIGYRSADGQIPAQLWPKNWLEGFRPSSTFARDRELIGVTHLPPHTYAFSLGWSF